MDRSPADVGGEMNKEIKPPYYLVRSPVNETKEQRKEREKKGLPPPFYSYVAYSNMRERNNG